ncbi:MAG: carboxypeptidase-like regulatory domain-containing protein [Aigarchaeota archaeon]|nr:carboxypeptidase-like regulatory domain-containing protein [Aigarchaeota archaeon]MDW7986389.1 carboxypeptidase-like regulatory domain-containing protein [Nitrososphaerota archaeon]
MMSGRHQKDILITTLLITFLLTALYYVPVDAQSPNLVVKIVDPLGNPLEKIEVLLAKDSESYRFVTNSTGYAVFSGLSKGSYSLKARIDKVIVAEAVVNFPTVSEIVVTANISELKIKLIDLDKKPVPSAKLKLVSSTGLAEYDVTSNEEGEAVITKIPYSTLKDIKGYNLKIMVEDYTIFSTSNLVVNEPKSLLEYTLPLLNLNLTMLNMEGEQVSRATIKLKAENYSRSVRVDRGFVSIKQIPSSDLEWVRTYTINVTYTVGGVEYTVYSAKRTLTTSQSLDLILELAKLEVLVLGDEDKPLRDVFIYLSNKRSQNFTQHETDEDGRTIFTNIPISSGTSQAGEYIVQLYKLNKKIGERRVEIISAKTTITFNIAKSPIQLYLRDYNKEPVTGYEVILTDIDSGEKYSGTTEHDGRLDLKMFPGRYDIQIAKNGKVIYKNVIDIVDSPLILDIEEINFPFKIQIIDTFANPIKNLDVLIRLGGEEVYSGTVEQLLTLTIPYSGYITIDIRSSGTLLWRETILADGPAEKTVRLDGYVDFLGLLLPIENVALMISVVASSIMIFIGLLIIYKRFRKRRLITK